jgi:hypothetical protein
LHSGSRFQRYPKKMRNMKNIAAYWINLKFLAAPSFRG